MSRALFSHVVPIVLRHYYNPFQLKDTPAIREDDTPAVSLANWRLAYGNPGSEAATSNGHSGSKGGNLAKPKKETKLALRLLWHFRRLYALQAVGGQGACAVMSLTQDLLVLVDMGGLLLLLLASRPPSFS